MNELTTRQRTLVEKYISDVENLSLKSIDDCISNCQYQLNKYETDIGNIQDSCDSKIGILTEFKRFKTKTPRQQIILEDYDPSIIQLEAQLFCDALKEKIKDIELDMSGLKIIRDVFLDKYGTEALSNPTTPRSQLDASPKLNKSPPFRAWKSASSLLSSPRRK